MHIMFVYWGRRGLSELVYDMASQTGLDFTASYSIAEANELFADFAKLKQQLFPVKTFNSNLGAIGRLWRLPGFRRRFLADLKARGVTDVVAVMPHVWMPLIIPTVRRAGIRFHTILHDATTHPGDPTALALPLLLRCGKQADRVFTLSETVARQLVSSGRIEAKKISILFHPDITFGTPMSALARPQPGEAWRLLFLGRVQAYKGLPLLVQTVRLLRQQGHPVHLGVYGAGDLGAEAESLRELNADVVNRWLTPAEMQGALTRHHALVLAHVEASQSGVAAAALGHGLPIVATPVGGLQEQVGAGGLGVVAQRCDAPALAEAIRQLFSDEGMFEDVRRNISASRPARTTAAFMQKIAGQLLSDRAANGKSPG